MTLGLGISLSLSSSISYGAEIDVTRQELVDLIAKAEKKYRIPRGLLFSIAKIESKLKPNAINVSGKASVFRSAENANEYIIRLVQEGITNIDVGVMQLNYRWHGDKFTGIDQMLEPDTNIDYAGKLLKSLYEQHGSWHKAVRFYHSATPYHHRRYSRKVIMAWIGG